jgi:hypothetical protein
MSWPLVQRSPIVCGMTECDHEASTVRSPRPTTDCRAEWGGGGGELEVTSGDIRL